MKVIIDSMAWLPKDEIRDVDLFVLKRKLTLIPKKTSPHSDPVPVRMFVETETAFGIPREYYFATKKQEHDEIDRTSRGYPLNSSIRRIKLRSNQNDVANKVLSYFANNFGCCVEAETGWGKTIFGLYVARELGCSTLIIVHKTTLVDQWMKRITGDPESDDELLRRGFLPEAKVGTIGNRKLVYEDCDFVIGTVQSLYEKGFPNNFFTSFGTTIVDEVHRMGSEKWGKAAPRIKSRYRLGLSATIRRKDQAENVFFYHIGRIIAKGRGSVMEPTIYRVETGFSLVRTPKFDPDKMEKGEVVTALIDAAVRNDWISGELMKALSNSRRVVCVSDRVDHLKKLMKLLDYRATKAGRDFTMGEFFKGGERRTQEELDEAKRQDCMFGTYKMIEDGEDIPDLDCLFMATPISDPEQVVGRIRRFKEGKRNPIVIDVRDSDILKCRQLAWARDRIYAKKGWKVYDIN